MALTPQRDKVLFLPVIRGLYDRSMTKRVKAAMRQAARTLGIDGVFPDDAAFTEGLIFKETDAAAYWETWNREAARIKALVVFSADFMWERSVMETVRLLPQDTPVLLFVQNDNPQTLSESGNVGDALCGSLSVHHNLRMLGRRVLDTRRLDMNDPVVLESQLRDVLVAVDGIEALRATRVGLIGVNPTPFATTFCNQMELFRLGFTLHTFELLDMWGDVVLGPRVEGKPAVYHGDFGEVRLASPIRRDDPRVDETIVRAAALGLAMPNDAEKTRVMARALLWVQDAFEREAIDTGAIHCWPEFARFFGVAPCAFAMWSNVLLKKPLVCEGDAPHAIMARMGQAMSGEPAAILDVNNNGWEPRVFNAFHCSQTPPNWLAEGGAVTDKGHVTGPMKPALFTAVSAATSANGFHAVVFTGRILGGPSRTGSNGWTFVPNLPDVIEAIEERGIHHFVAMKGLIARQAVGALRFRGMDVADCSSPREAVESPLDYPASGPLPISGETPALWG